MGGGAQQLGLNPLMQPMSTGPRKYVCAHKCGEKGKNQHPQAKALPAGAAEVLLLGLEALTATSWKPASFNGRVLASWELQSTSEQKEIPGTRPHPGSEGDAAIKRETQ